MKEMTQLKVKTEKPQQKKKSSTSRCISPHCKRHLTLKLKSYRFIYSLEIVYLHF